MSVGIREYRVHECTCARALCVFFVYPSLNTNVLTLTPLTLLPLLVLLLLPLLRRRCRRRRVQEFQDEEYMLVLTPEQPTPVIILHQVALNPQL
jgi:hypothetical protein